MFISKNITIYTSKYNQMIRISGEVEQAVSKSGIKNGFLTVITQHTTTGIAVNESLKCLESDIQESLSNLVPEDYPYNHARMLRDYGSTAGNATGHLKSHYTGNHCHFLITNGEIAKGGAQDIYFFEFDGPAKRTYSIVIAGD